MPTRHRRHRHARILKKPLANPRDRASIPASAAPHVDTFLKDLRTCSHQLDPFEACLNDELRILERLYYKGVNQHRSAIFWRRIEEARKFGKRVAELQLHALIEDTRYAFYVAEDAERQSKVLKTVWKHIPAKAFLTFLTERISAAEGLLQEASNSFFDDETLLISPQTTERMGKVYHSLELMLQTGAFLQTVLMLTAVVSRLHTISDGIRTCLRSPSSGLKSLTHHLDLKQAETTAFRGPEPNLPGKRSDESPQATENFVVSIHTPDKESLDKLTTRQPSTQTSSHPKANRRSTESVITFVSNPIPPSAQSKVKKAKADFTKKKKRDAIDDIFASL